MCWTKLFYFLHFLCRIYFLCVLNTITPPLFSSRRTQTPPGRGYSSRGSWRDPRADGHLPCLRPRRKIRTRSGPGSSRFGRDWNRWGRSLRRVSCRRSASWSGWPERRGTRWRRISFACCWCAVGGAWPWVAWGAPFWIRRCCCWSVCWCMRRDAAGCRWLSDCFWTLWIFAAFWLRSAVWSPDLRKWKMVKIR